MFLNGPRMAARITKLVAFILLGISPTFAQTVTQEAGLGAINGEITDTSGLVVPDVTVTAVNLKTGAERVVMTSTLGFYTIPALPPGSYRISASKTGFGTQVRQDVPLEVQQILSVNFGLAVGSVTDTVTVTGEAPVLEATNTTIGQVINQVQTTELPLNGRQFSQLALLSPGAAPVGGWIETFVNVAVGTGGINPSINGITANFNNYTLDGADNNNKFANYWAISPPPDAIEEVRVQTGLYAGSNINVSTKSGTNEFHGTAWEFFRNDKLDARNTFDAAKPPYRQNQYGVAAGGPVYLPKLMDGRNTGTWIFGYWEGYRSRKSQTYFGTVPTEAMLNGDFSALLGPALGTDSQGNTVNQREMFNPFTTRANPSAPGQLIRDPFPGNRIPQSLISPLAVEYLKFFYPLPNQSTFPNNYVSEQSTATDTDQWGLRVDQRVGHSDFLFGRVNVNNASAVMPSPLPANPNINENRTRTVLGSYTRVFSPTLVLNLSAGYTRDYTPYYNPGISKDFQQRLGMTDLIPPYQYKGTIYLAPNIDISPTFTDVNELGFFLGAPDYSYQFNGNFSKNFGNHNLSFGAIGLKWRHITGVQPWFIIGFSRLTTGSPEFAADTGEGLASLLLGLNSSAAQSLIHQQNSYGWILDTFISDQWKVSRKLTINYGTHWNHRWGPYNLDNQVSVFNIATGQWQWAAKNPITGQAANLRSSIFNPHYTDFAPQLGFAYQLTPKTVLRSGFSMTYDHGITMVQGNQELLGNYPFGSRGSDFNQNVGIPSGVTLTHPLFGESAPTPDTTPAITGNPWNRTPYVMQWNFGLQREVAPNTVLSADYVGTRGRRLMMQLQYNTAVTPAPGDISARQPFPQFGPFALDTNEGKSDYDSLQTKIERRFSKGLTFLASYTWSKAIGTASLPVGNTVQDPYNINASRGLLSFNVPHMFVFSSVYELPFGRGKAFLSSNRALSALAGGWTLSAIVSLYAGTPLTVLVPFDNANTGSNWQRADLVGDPNQNAPKTRQEWFNTAAFAVPARNTYGNSGNGILQAPGIENLDITASRRFRISEHKQLEFRFESFNLLNHTNLGTPDTNITSFTFGSIFSARELRDIQLSLKFLW